MTVPERLQSMTVPGRLLSMTVPGHLQSTTARDSTELAQNRMRRISGTSVHAASPALGKCTRTSRLGF